MLPALFKMLSADFRYYAAPRQSLMLPLFMFTRFFDAAAFHAMLCHMLLLILPLYADCCYWHMLKMIRCQMLLIAPCRCFAHAPPVDSALTAMAQRSCYGAIRENTSYKKSFHASASAAIILICRHQRHVAILFIYGITETTLSTRGHEE